MTRPALVGLSLFSVILVGWLLYSSISFCTGIPTEPPERGSHGFRLWQGASLKSFSQNSEKICVPHGWESVGANAEGDGWATFGPGKTGVMILPADFASTTLSFKKSSFTVRLLYPMRTSTENVSVYRHLVTNAFERIGALFPDTGVPRSHTVVVTAGLGVSGNERDALYPDPDENVSYLVLPPNHTRSEEFFIHAIAHLYNRFRPDLDTYENAQSPLSSIDFQEMEAAWSETAFEASDANRLVRLQYLYQIHHAVMTKDFSSLLTAPFNNRDDVAKLHPGLPTTATSTYLEYQYNHYVLAPLLLTAIEGLLQTYRPDVTVSSLLTHLHENPSQSFFESLKKVLPEKAMREMYTWMNGSAEIPVALITAAIARYDAQKQD